MSDQSFKNKNLRPKGKSNQQLVSKKQVRDMIRSITSKEELKFLDTNANASSVDFSGILSLLSDPLQGDGSSERVGDRLTLVKLELRLNLEAADSTNLMRFMLVQYFPSASPSVTTFLQNTGSGASPISQYSVATISDYKVLLDSGPINLVLGQANTQRSFKYLNVTNFSKKVVVFASNTTAASNHLYLLVISDSGAIPNPSISYNIRLWYTDD